MVEYFRGFKTEQRNRVIEKRILGSPDSLIIHMGTNDWKATRNLDFVVTEVYALVATTKRGLPNRRIVQSEVLRRRDTARRLIGALNDRYNRVAIGFELTFVDPNTWIEDGDFSRNGLQLNGKGNRRLGKNLCYRWLI